ncbi:MAG: universal stress protein [Hydrogenophilales bacterium]|nr:universal stress protein [Hydrogenophilales bacterium]
MSPTLLERPVVPRIWVALDESPRSTAALTAAADLAAGLDAELAGLFVEDINLQHLIGLPFAREFSLLSGVGRPLSQDDVERTWRREAETLQRLLAEAAGSLRLRWSFHVARGRVSAEMNTLAQAFDLIVLGRRSGIQVMTVSRTAARHAGNRPRTGPVLVLLDEGSISARSLDLGVMLARRHGAELLLLIDAENEDAYRVTCAAAQTALKARETSGRCVWLIGINGSKLIQVARREEAGCLVLPDKERFLRTEGLDRVLDEIECPIVLTG